MPDIRLATFVAISATVVIGTIYSVVYNTYLDTSDPLLTHRPHPLGTTHYYANKSNFLNVYFIKKAWAWTSAGFLFSWFTSPPRGMTRGRMLKWVIETAMWLIFTGWFFGPALFERIILASGGECILSLPSGDLVSVPTEFCISKSHISPTSHPNLFTSSLNTLPINWRAFPRLRRGHDVSGHIFLLTMSALFLADQLRYSFRVKQYSKLHHLAVGINVVLIGICIFAAYTTSLYFHSPFEKFTGYCLGVAGFAISQMIRIDIEPADVVGKPHNS